MSAKIGNGRSWKLPKPVLIGSVILKVSHRMCVSMNLLIPRTAFRQIVVANACEHCVAEKGSLEYNDKHSQEQTNHKTGAP